MKNYTLKLNWVMTMLNDERDDQRKWNTHMRKKILPYGYAVGPTPIWILLNHFESEWNDIYIMARNVFLLILFVAKFSYLAREPVFFLWRETPSGYFQLAMSSSMTRCSVVIDWWKFLSLINRFWWIRACILRQQSELLRNMGGRKIAYQCENGIYAYSIYFHLFMTHLERESKLNNDHVYMFILPNVNVTKNET